MGAMGQLFTGHPTEDYYTDFGKSGNLDQYKGQVAQGTNTLGSAVSGEQGLSQSLFDQMNGGGPNLANAQLQQGLGQVQKQQAGAIASNRGINGQLAATDIYNKNADLSMQAAQQASINRQQQQLAAQGQLGQVLGAEGQQGLGEFGEAGGLSNQLQGYLQAAAANTASTNASQAASGEQLVGSLAKNGGSGASGIASLAAAHGAVVPGEPKHPGVDDEENDTVTGHVEGGGQIKVTPGEGILPLSVMEDPEKAAEFARHLVLKNRKKHRTPARAEV